MRLADGEAYFITCQAKYCNWHCVKTILEYYPVSGGGMVVKGGYGDGGLFNMKRILLKDKECSFWMR